MKTFFLSFFIPVCIFLFQSCGPTRLPIGSISSLDERVNIFYLQDASSNNANSICMRTIADSIERLITIKNENLNIITISSESPLEPSASGDGNFVAVSDELPEGANVGLRLYEKEFGIYDVANEKIILHGVTRVPKTEYGGEEYAIPWSKKDDGFFIMNGDTINKYYTDGNHHIVAHIEDLLDFSMSPSEQEMIFVQSTRVGLINFATGESVLLKELGSPLGFSPLRPVRGIAWSPDGFKVVFASGLKMYVYNLQTKELTEHKANRKVFNIEWVSDSEFVYVEGIHTSDIAIMNNGEFFEMIRYNYLTLERNSLYLNFNHEPISIMPKRSPSGQLLVFSEKEPQMGHQVKLLTIDGNNLTVLCNGYKPVWGR